MDSLNTIGLKHGTDKNSNYHDYLKVYEQYLTPYRSERIYLLELGYGGYEYEDRGGESARTWHEYFPSAQLVYLDLYEKKDAIKDRIDFFCGSQTDKNLLRTILKRGEDYSRRIVIDDASHNNTLTIETFNIIFPQLKSGDLYFVEDVHTSYWAHEEYGGNAKPATKGTTMDFFATLTHQLNGEHLQLEHQNQYARMIEFIHFYKELIVIKRL